MRECDRCRQSKGGVRETRYGDALCGDCLTATADSFPTEERRSIVDPGGAVATHETAYGRTVPLSFAIKVF